MVILMEAPVPLTTPAVRSEPRLLERARRWERREEPLVIILFAIVAADGASLPAEAIDLVGDSLRTGVRASDTVTRIGADRFAIVLPEMPLDAARRITARLTGHVQRDAGSLVEAVRSARIRCGVAAQGPHCVTIVDLVAAAEADMAAAHSRPPAVGRG